MKSKYIAIILTVFWMSACDDQNNSKENKELARQLIGEWKSSSLDIQMNTFNNKDTTRLFSVNESSWEQKMNIRPIKTVYLADGSYFSVHRNLNDSVIFNPGGRWEIMGDSIFLRDTFPEGGMTYSYKLFFEKDLVKFTGIEDCDNDGKKDDDYSGTLKRQQHKPGIDQK